MFCGHDLFHDLSRRHRLRRVTQDVVDSTTTLAMAKPVIVTASPRGPNCDEDVVGIEQANGRVQMRQIRATRVDLALEALENSGHFQSLLTQGRDNRQL